MQILYLAEAPDSMSFQSQPHRLTFCLLDGVARPYQTFPAAMPSDLLYVLCETPGWAGYHTRCLESITDFAIIIGQDDAAPLPRLVECGAGAVLGARPSLADGPPWLAAPALRLLRPRVRAGLAAASRARCPSPQNGRRRPPRPLAALLIAGLQGDGINGDVAHYGKNKHGLSDMVRRYCCLGNYSSRYNNFPCRGPGGARSARALLTGEEVFAAPLWAVARDQRGTPGVFRGRVAGECGREGLFEEALRGPVTHGIYTRDVVIGRSLLPCIDATKAYNETELIKPLLAFEKDQKYQSSQMDMWAESANAGGSGVEFKVPGAERLYCIQPVDLFERPHAVG
ncbi:hypothetical protein NDU88_001236 [Pleurodeles waltl]|uniref:Uncharacterized protein n=1 Tax=Pleurodeles waltl TaxID=8319 RepID=A0AAV7V8Z4_PLEWA|nr:hypothetical protein NDU88_001236 [Pleurodeles waltl]